MRNGDNDFSDLAFSIFQIRVKVLPFAQGPSKLPSAVILFLRRNRNSPFGEP